MPAMNPAVPQWIRQMADVDQVVAYFAYQSLLEEVLHSTAPGQAAAQTDLARALGEALVAQSAQGARGQQPSASSSNPFLAAAARQTVPYQHPARVRVNLARLLGYLPHEAVVPYLAKALGDLEAREMARCSLESNPSERATEALAGVIEAAGSTFRIGVLNSLSKRKGAAAVAALRRAAEDPQPEVRMAAWVALADVPDSAHDAVLEKAVRTGTGEESRQAHVARARLAQALRADGNKQAAERIYKSILASDAPEPQKKAARLALGMG
jgi:HEAT repeat protein